VTAKRKRQDFVMLPRAAWSEVFERYGLRIGGLLTRLVLEADHRTGIVHGSVRSLAGLIGMKRDSLTSVLDELGSEVDVIRGKNRYAPGSVRIVRYQELAGLREETSSGPPSGPPSGPKEEPLELPDQHKPKFDGGDKTQDSVLSVPSFVPSINRSAATSRTRTSPPMNDNEERTKEEEQKRAIARSLREQSS
jgi:hypothetical protein